MKILVVGCSYTYGSGCDDRAWYFDDKTQKWIPERPNFPLPGPSKFGWATLLQNALPEHEVINLAMPGHDNSRMFNDAVSRKDIDNVDLIIFAGTSENRMRVAEPIQIGNNATTSWVLSNMGIRGSDEYKKAQEYFIKHLYHPSIQTDTSVLAIHAIDALANRINAKLLWHLQFWDTGFNDPRLNRLRNNQFKSIIEFIKYNKSNDGTLNPEYLSPCFHANNRGHQEYFDEYLLPLVKQTLNI